MRESFCFPLNYELFSFVTQRKLFHFLLRFVFKFRTFVPINVVKKGKCKLIFSKILGKRHFQKMSKIGNFERVLLFFKEKPTFWSENFHYLQFVLKNHAFWVRREGGGGEARGATRAILSLCYYPSVWQVGCNRYPLPMHERWEQMIINEKY